MHYEITFAKNVKSIFKMSIKHVLLGRFKIHVKSRTGTDDS